MGRRRKFYSWDIPNTVVAVVKTLCADYQRRKIALERDTVSGAVKDEYARINAAIDLALNDIEEGIKDIVLQDVVSNRGYDFSQASPFIAKNTYYNRKRKLVYDIAAGLNLIP